MAAANATMAVILPWARLCLGDPHKQAERRRVDIRRAAERWSLNSTHHFGCLGVIVKMTLDWPPFERAVLLTLNLTAKGSSRKRSPIPRDVPDAGRQQRSVRAAL